ncbi:hypothetical protein J4409_02425 [Candidatus Woesearchaeota archaeon]|nr:hypothetical protein [Candidatus Woesearchaeota archaeon]
MAKKSSKEKVVDDLIEYNIALQNKTAELISSIGKLVKRIDDMVVLFEEAAKNIKAGTDEPLMRRLSELLDQNKNIARGLILLERYVKERAVIEESFPPRPLPKF